MNEKKIASKPKTKYAPESLTGPFQFWHTIDRDGYQIFISTLMMAMTIIGDDNDDVSHKIVSDPKCYFVYIYLYILYE